MSPSSITGIIGQSLPLVHERIIPSKLTSTNFIYFFKVLPFVETASIDSVDWWNQTGQYRTMVDNCFGPDGQRKCFYKVGGGGCTWEVTS
jgi:hypothetical protein